MPAAPPDRGPFPLPRSARIALFASGRGSNLASLLAAFPPATSGAVSDADASHDRARDRADAHAGAAAPLARVALAIVNVPGAPAAERARAAGVPVRELPWRRGHGTRRAFEAAAQAALDHAGIDLICLAGFMRILSPAFTARWAGRIVNVHPSLLPAFRGLHAQRQALAAGVAESGCTIHLVDAGVDSGRILLQRRVPVRPDDDETTLAARILEQEHLAYPEAVRGLLRGQAACVAASGREADAATGPPAGAVTTGATHDRTEETP